MKLFSDTTIKASQAVYGQVRHPISFLHLFCSLMTKPHIAIVPIPKNLIGGRLAQICVIMMFYVFS